MEGLDGLGLEHAVVDLAYLEAGDELEHAAVDAAEVRIEPDFTDPVLEFLRHEAESRK